jgi:hypothetical protein
MTNDPNVVKILELLEEVGLYHSYSRIISERVIIESGVDFERALKIRGFYDAITGGTGMFDQSTVQKNILPARRALLAHVADVLQKWGAKLKDKEAFRGPNIDEAYHFEIAGRNIDFFLMS